MHALTECAAAFGFPCFKRAVLGDSRLTGANTVAPRAPQKPPLEFLEPERTTALHAGIPRSTFGNEGPSRHESGMKRRLALCPINAGTRSPTHAVLVFRSRMKVPKRAWSTARVPRHSGKARQDQKAARFVSLRRTIMRRPHSGHFGRRRAASSGTRSRSQSGFCAQPRLTRFALRAKVC